MILDLAQKGVFLPLPANHCVCVLQSVLQHPAVGDCAVVGLEDKLKGVVPLALCVLKNGEAHVVMQ